MASSNSCSIISQIQNQPGDNLSSKTHNMIQTQKTDSAKMNTIAAILNTTSAEFEELVEILHGALNLLRSRRIWRARFATQQEAEEALLTPSLKRLINHPSAQRSKKTKYREEIQGRWGLILPLGTPSSKRSINHPSAQRSKKTKYRERIQERWGLAIPAKQLDGMGENYLYHAEAMARRFTYVDAITLATRMAVRRLQSQPDKQGGRVNSKRLTTGDWKGARSLTPPAAMAILESRGFTVTELNCFDPDTLDWIQPNILVW